jgi:hypothetical protein
MGYEKRRRNGRWTALYELRPNVYRSAGTFDTRAEAEEAWREQERSLRMGNFVDPARARMTFARYVEEKFLPLHTGTKVNTRKNYASDLRAHAAVLRPDAACRDLSGARAAVGAADGERRLRRRDDSHPQGGPVHRLLPRRGGPVSAHQSRPRGEDPKGAAATHPGHHPRRTPTVFSRTCRVRSAACWSSWTSTPGCAGVRSPNSAGATS